MTDNIINKVKNFHNSIGIDLHFDLDRGKFLYENINQVEKIVLPDNQKIDLISASENYNLKDLLGEIEIYKKIINQNRSFLIYFSCYDIPHAENYILSAADFDIIKKTGLDIFLPEILIKHKIDRSDNNSKAHKKSVFEVDQEECIEIMLLDSIDKIAKKNKIHINVYCCESNLPRFIHDRYKNLTIKYFDLFFRKQLKVITDDDFLELDAPSFRYKFISLNRRYDIHRHLCVLYLSKKNCLLGWSFKGQWDDIKKNLWFDIEKWKYSCPAVYDTLFDAVDDLNKNVPLQLDYKNTKAYWIQGVEFDFYQTPFERKNYNSFLKDQKIKGIYSDAFCAVVNLTRFADFGSYVDEKVLMPMLAKRPFIVLGKAGSLGLLKSYGFKTFGDFWDESYDSISNNEERLRSIFKLIDRIDQITVLDLQKILKEMEPILEHNQQLLIRLGKENDQ